MKIERSDSHLKTGVVPVCVHLFVMCFSYKDAHSLTIPFK